MQAHCAIAAGGACGAGFHARLIPRSLDFFSLASLVPTAMLTALSPNPRLKQNALSSHITGMKKTRTEPLQSQRLNPLNDFLFYKVMGEKGDEPQLIGFLNAVLAPSGRKPIESLEIVEKKNFVKEMLEGKSCSLDVMAVLADGARANIEVQLRDKRNMDRRSLFYWSKLYAEALEKGHDYRELPDAIAINIVGYDFPPGGGAHTRFRLREASDPSLELTSAMEIHFINVVKWRGQREKDIANNPLHRWLAWLDPESPRELAEEAKGMDSAIASADERQAFVMQKREARELYEMRQKAERDRRSEIAFALEKGMAQGMEKGRRIGERKGMEKIARNALAKGASAEFVHEITGLAMEEIAGLGSGK